MYLDLNLSRYGMESDWVIIKKSDWVISKIVVVSKFEKIENTSFQTFFLL